MDVQLIPHVGAASFRLGMPFDEAMAEAAAWWGHVLVRLLESRGHDVVESASGYD
ncbi:hypothetical protein [Streptomyces sp. NPDC003660]